MTDLFSTKNTVPKLILFVFIMSRTIGFPMGASGAHQEKIPAESLRLSPHQIKRNIDYLWENLIQIHPDGPAIEARLKTHHQKTIAQAVKSMSVGDFYLLATSLVAGVNDGHTNLSFQFNFAGIRYFPMDLAFIGDNVYVMKDYTPGHRGEPEIRLITINGIPVTTMREKFFRLMPGETRSFKKRGLDSDLFKVLYHLTYPDDTEATLTLQSFGQEVYSRRIQFMDRHTIKSMRSQVPEDGLRLTINKSTAVMKIHTFDEKDIVPFFKHSFSQLKKNTIRHLIIDIRDNLGGHMDNMETLIGYLVSKPVWPLKGIQVRSSRQFKSQAKTRIPKMFRWLPLERLDKRGRKIWNAPEGSLVTIPESKPIIPVEEKYRYDGEIIVLINGHTYSAASLFAHIVQKYRLGTIAGVESGGTAGYSFGEAMSVEIPDTPITLNVSSLLILVKDMKKSRRGVIPDIPIRRDIAEEVAGLDSQLIRIKDWIKKGKLK